MNVTSEDIVSDIKDHRLKYGTDVTWWPDIVNKYQLDPLHPDHEVPIRYLKYVCRFHQAEQFDNRVDFVRQFKTFVDSTPYLVGYLVTDYLDLPPDEQSEMVKSRLELLQLKKDIAIDVEHHYHQCQCIP